MPNPRSQGKEAPAARPDVEAARLDALTLTLDEMRARHAASIADIDRMKAEIAATREATRRADLPTLLTLNEVAKILNVGYSGAREWAIRGVIPSVRIHREIRVPQRALEDWIATLPKAGDYDPIAIEAERLRQGRRRGAGR